VSAEAAAGPDGGAEPLLRRRLARERAARLAAEQIAEENSRALFLQSQALEESLVVQRRLTADVEALLAGLESFSSQLRPEQIVESLHRFLSTTVDQERLAVAIEGPDGARELVVHATGAQAGRAEVPREPTLATGPGTGLDAARTLPIARSGRPTPGTRLLLPMRVGGRAIGTVALDSAAPDAFSGLDVRYVQALVDEAALALQNALLYEEVSRLSTTDPLTRLLNRRGFDQAADLAVRVAVRHGRPLSALMVDIDHFKRVNDRFGHGTGDEALATVARVCAAGLRSTDLVGRYGGEEFCLVLPETGAADAVTTAARLRAGVAATAIPVGEDVLRMTISVGIAECRRSGDSLDALLGRADEALYASKRAGRDRETVWAPPPDA
jgi:diguanylate cyclase (GGDEF)-like protein